MLLSHIVGQHLIHVDIEPFLAVIQVPLSLIRLELDLNQLLKHVLNLVGSTDSRGQERLLERHVQVLLLLQGRLGCLRSSGLMIGHIQQQIRRRLGLRWTLVDHGLVPLH